MKTTFFTTMVLMMLTSSGYGQSGSISNTLGSGGAFVIKNASDDSLFLVNSDGGALLSRMTSAERSAIASPATGLLVYQADGSDGFYYFTGNSWKQVATSSPTAQKNWISPHYSFGTGTISTQTIIYIVNPDLSTSPGIRLYVYDLFGLTLCSTTQVFIGPMDKLSYVIPESCPGVTPAEVGSRS